MKTFKNTGVIAVVTVLLLCLLTACGTGKAEPKALFDVEFHRGGRDARPENTLYSFQYAIENGANTIECDMQMTKDGQIVLSHNSVLNPDITTDSEGRYVEPDRYYIHDMTLEEVQNFNVGKMDPASEYYALHGASQVQADTEIPSLRQVFELVRDSGDEDLRISIEAKNFPSPDMGIAYEKSPDVDALLKEFLSLVQEFGFQKRVLLQAFDWSVLVKMKEMDPSIETVALYSEQPSWGLDGATLWLDKEEASPWLAGLNIHDFDDDPVKAAASLGIDLVSPYYAELTPEQVEEAHELGMKVVPWTVNQKEDMEKMFDMGVDGMVTDKPWVLREFLQSKGEKVRPEAKIDLPYHLEPEHFETTGDNSSPDGQDAAY